MAMITVEHDVARWSAGFLAAVEAAADGQPAMIEAKAA